MLQHLNTFIGSRPQSDLIKHSCDTCDTPDEESALEPDHWSEDPATSLIFKTCPTLFTRICEMALSLDMEILECRLKQAQQCFCAKAGGEGIRVSHRGLKVPADLKPDTDPDVIYLGQSGPVESNMKDQFC